jgi:hypothetical protein
MLPNRLRKKTDYSIVQASDKIRIRNLDHGKTALNIPGMSDPTRIEEDLGLIGARPGIAEKK